MRAGKEISGGDLVPNGITPCSVPGPPVALLWLGSWQHEAAEQTGGGRRRAGVCGRNA